jgi:hypothetical protein
MQYAVPQFIEVEDKVIGPLTTKQFLYLVAGGVFLLVVWSLADISLFVIIALLTAGIVIPFAFVKINGRPFEIFVTAAFNYFTKPKLRLWIKDYKTIHTQASDIAKRRVKMPEGQMQEAGGKKTNRSNIQQLSQILDMGSAAYQTESAEAVKKPEKEIKNI